MSTHSPLLTVFALPKPFRGHLGTIQRNALRSWVALGSAVEVILLGDDHGVAEVASEFGLVHIPEIERNQFGTPMINSIFEKTRASATAPTLAYVNADILLTGDVLRVLELIPFEQFLISCRRWNLDVREEIDFSSSDWENQIRDRTAAGGSLGPSTAMDCFIFPKGMYEQMPPFGVGRAGWDNWLIYRARSRRIPVIDATDAMMIIHQDHDYSHHPMGRNGAHSGPEADWNIKLAGGRDFIFTLDNADWMLDAKGLRRPRITLHRIMRRVRSLPALYPSIAPLMRPVVFAGKLAARWFVVRGEKF